VLQEHDESFKVNVDEHPVQAPVMAEHVVQFCGQVWQVPAAFTY